MRSERGRKWTTYRAWLLLFIMAGLLLRFTFIGQKSFWFDEGFSVSQAVRTQEQIWQRDWERPESHPPLYYSGLHYWVDWFGTDEAPVRLPSAIASVLNVGLLYLLALRLFGERVALLAAALLALSPLSIWYAQEARMYVFVTSAGLLAANLMLWGRWVALPLLAAVLALGLYLDYTMLPLWTLLSAFWLVVWWREGRRLKPFVIWLGGSVGAWLLYRPWLDNFYDVLASFNDVHVFVRLQETIGLPFLTPVQYVLVMLAGGAVLFAVAGVGSLLLSRRRIPYLVALLLVIGFGLATLLFPVPRLYALKRLLVLGWPYVALAVAWLVVVVMRGRRRAVQALLIVSIAASAVSVFFVPKDDWRGAVAYLNESATSEDLVWLDPFWNLTIYNLYEPAVVAQHDRLTALEEAATGSVWLVAERVPGEPTPTSASEAWLDRNLQLVERVPFYRLEVRHYRLMRGAGG